MGSKRKQEFTEQTPTPEFEEAPDNGQTEEVAVLPIRETNEERFVRLSNYRMPKAIKAIRSIRHLTNKSAYKWTEDQANKIVARLEEEVNTLRSAFAGSKMEEDTWKL